MARAKNAMLEDTNVIRVGSSPMTPAQLLMQLRTKVNEVCPNVKFQIVPFENTLENAREILGNLGRNIDIVGGIFDETMLALRGCAGLELVRVPFQCAVSIHHRLAEKDHLRLSDLYGENLMLMHRGWSHYVDQLRDDLWQHHPQIHIIDFDFYNMDILNRCESSSNVLLSRPPAGQTCIRCSKEYRWSGTTAFPSAFFIPRIPRRWCSGFWMLQRPWGGNCTADITRKYTPMNQARLLRNPRFFYNEDGSGKRGKAGNPPADGCRTTE